MFVLCAVSFGAGSLVTWLSVRGRAHAELPKPRLALPAPRRAVEDPVVVEPVVPQKSSPIKGNSKTLVYHTPDSPYYKRTKGDLMFASEAEAIAAGYRMWTTKARVKPEAHVTI
jgi:hypothetical protein